MDESLQELLDGFDRELEQDQEQLRVLVLGSSEWIVQTIHQLHQVGFAEAGDWSPLLPLPKSRSQMCILARSRRR